MASLPAANDTAEPFVAAEIIVLNPAEIEVGERLREVDPVHAEAVGWSMVKDGQINPIDVCRLPGRVGWHLAGPGGHRLAGALIVGMDGIESRVVSPNRDTRRLREAVENFFRRANDPIERAAAVAEIVEIKRRKAGLDTVARRDAQVGKHLKRQIDAEADANLETISKLYGWTDEIGAELGFTGRTIRNDLLIYRGIAPSLVSQLRAVRHPVLKNATQLRGLAKLDGSAQHHAVDALIAGAKSVAEATRTGTNRPSDPEAKRLSAFIGAFSRMGVAEKKAALFQLESMLPAGIRLEVDQASSPTKVDLHEVISFIEDHQLNEHDADWIIAETAKRFGGTARYLNGTYELRVSGVVGTCTSAGSGQLSSWKRAARKRLLGLEKTS